MSSVNASLKKYDRNNPFMATVAAKYPITKSGSKKHSQHVVLDIAESKLIYHPGDSVAITPLNDPIIVAKTIDALKASGGETILDKRSNKKYTLHDYLTQKVSITKPTKRVLSLLYSHQSNCSKKEFIGKLLMTENKNEMDTYLSNHQLWDLLELHYEAKVDLQELCSILLPMAPRLYSIASSQKKDRNVIEIAVTEVRYNTNDIIRYGVCSNYLCSRVDVGDKIALFIHKTEHFYLPEDSNISIIMVGPGTGVAPFRGFMQERIATNSSGKNWLFFGDWNRDYDFYYEEEWADMVDAGKLYLDTAFSRDQEHKIYVQHKILEHSSKIWQWLQNGAYFYICGDAFRMAKDVESSILKIAQKEGCLSEEESYDYINKMKEEYRLRLDIY